MLFPPLLTSMQSGRIFHRDLILLFLLYQDKKNGTLMCSVFIIELLKV